MYELITTSSSYVQVNDNNSSIALVIGWYPLKNVTKFLTKHNALNNIAVLGNLFNPVMGVDLLFRNLLHNPHITQLILFAGTTQDKVVGSVNSVLKALNNYEYFKDICTLMPPISSTEYEQLQLIKTHTCNDIASLLSLLRQIPEQEKSNRQKITKPIIQEIAVQSYAGRQQSQYIEALTVENAHTQAVNRILINGQDTNNIRELLNLNICVTQAPTTIDDLMDITTENEQDYINSFLYPQQESINYNYGHRLKFHSSIDLVEASIKKLQRKPQSLATLLPVYCPTDLIQGDSPCLTQIWLRILNNELLLFATFRSNDIWKAWKHNVYGLRAIQIYIAEKLDIKPGYIHTNSLSAHLYLFDIPTINLDIECSSKQNYVSAVGNFHICVDRHGINVTQTTQQGRFIQEYSGNNSLKLIREITQKNPSIEPDHIGYLGIEIQKAVSAIKAKTPYTQDI